MSEPEVVAITGASAGIGRATAIAFARRGAKVGLIARGKAGLAAAARDVEAAGGTALAVPADVADADQVEAAAAAIEESLGPIDVWVNNAMTAVLGEARECTPAEFKRVTEVTYLGAVHGAQAALRRFEARDRGTLVMVGSALGRRGIPLQSTYCAAKHAVQGFTESLRAELMHRGSNVQLTIVQLPGVNSTQFGWVRLKLDRTPQPVPPIYEPEVAAEAIVWAAHHKRRQVWVGLPTVLTIVGNWVAPWFMDRYLARTGYSSQQTDDPVPPGRRDSLFEPVDDVEDRGVHGPFGDQAHAHSPQLWLNLHRGTVLGAGAAAAGAAAVAALRR